MAQRAKTARNGFDYAAAWTALRDEVKTRYPIDAALGDEFPGIKFLGRGSHLKACCPFHVDKNPSFSVNADRGIYRCFSSGCGQSGDVFQLLQDRYNLGFREALLMAADRAGIPVAEELRESNGGQRFERSKPRPVRPRPTPDQIREVPAGLAAPNLTPVPDDVPRPIPGRPFRLWQNGGRGGSDFEPKTYSPEMVHEYRSKSGEHLLSILRIKLPNRKFFIPARLSVANGGCPKWLLQKTPEGPMAWVNDAGLDGSRRPIYGMEKLRPWIARGGSRLLIVEGEKTCDAMTRFLAELDPDTLVISPMGGGEATIFMDWAPFFDEILATGHRFDTVIWQDADSILERTDGTKVDRQRKYINQLSTSFLQGAIDAGLPREDFALRHLSPPEGVESGWDGADAIEQGWDGKSMTAFLANTKEVDMSQLKLREDYAPEIAAAGGPEELAPFDQDGPDAALAAAALRDNAADDNLWVDIESRPETDGVAEVDLEDTLDAFLNGDIEAAPAPVPAAPEPQPAPQGVAALAAHDGLIDEADNSEDDGYDPQPNPVIDNPFFRCMGYRDNSNFFLSIQSGQVFGLSARQMSREMLLSLAPLDFWRLSYPKEPGRNGGQNDGVDWLCAINELIQATYDCGPWDPSTQVVQGARLDGKTVVFHTGTRLFVDGRDTDQPFEGTCRIGEFNGKYCYTIGPNQCRTPAFSHPFEANSDDVARLLQLLRALDWRRGNKNLSVLATFGWITISPICGILNWRPHLWLDGPRSSGKSWIVNNLIAPAVGDYVEKVVGNTSESGLRNALNHRSVPVIFDEAEGENNSNRVRMQEILRLARHSASASNTKDAAVLQGVSGGGSQRHYSIASTFLMASIMPQLEAAADMTRFARASLGTGRPFEAFSAEIEGPAYDLLMVPQEIDGTEYFFADRLIARMVLRARDYNKTYRTMVQALCRLGLERRIADVYGTFATGAWLALRDDTPENHDAALFFLNEEFNAMDELISFNKDMDEEKDHVRIMEILKSRTIKVESPNYGRRDIYVGHLMEVAAGLPELDGEGSAMISREDAETELRNIGIRPACFDEKTEDFTPCGPHEEAQVFLIHRKSSLLGQMLKDTPYEKTAIDVMKQSDGAKISAKNCRFAPNIGRDRPLIVPIANFRLGE